MKYGRIITVNKRGFSVDSTSMQTVGIYKSSRCWGAVLENSSGDQNRTSDILVSPYPYKSWPCIVGLQVRILFNTESATGHKTDSIESITSILEVLSENDFNILSLDLSVGGRTHYILEVVGELYHMRDAAKKITSLALSERESEIINFAQELYLRMGKIVCGIHKVGEQFKCLYPTDMKAKLLYSDDAYTEAAEQKSDSYSTDQPDGRYKSRFGNGFEVDLEDIKSVSGEKCKDFGSYLKETNDFQKIKPVSFAWFRSLAYNTFKAAKTRINFSYDNEEGILKLDDKEFLDEKLLVKFLGYEVVKNLPAIALATFDTDNKYLRIKAYPRAGREESLYRFRYEYDFRIYDDSEHSEICRCGSRKLVTYMLEKIREKDRGFQPVRLSLQGLTRRSVKHESGIVLIHGISSKRLTKDSDDLDIIQESDLNSYMDKRAEEEMQNKKVNKENHQAIPNIHTSNVTIEKVSPFTVFVSARNDFLSRPGIRDSVTRVLSETGFDVKMSETFTKPVTDNVLSDLGVCDALIQLYSLSAKEIEQAMRDGDKADFSINHGWLLYELGIAKQMKVPIVRMIDTTNFFRKQWEIHIKTDKDIPFIEFNFSKNRESLEKGLKNAAHHLLNLLKNGKYHK